jgi:pimeloyl-ACP methyl ester carboxylesterase
LVIRNTRQLAMADKLLFPIPERGLVNRLYRIRAKTVIVWGESDRMIPPAHGERSARGSSAPITQAEADVARITARERKAGSQKTPRWREMDSNYRSPV